MTDPSRPAMTGSPTAAAAGRRPLDSRFDVQAALHEAFGAIARLQPRAVWLSDDDFVAWPLGESAVIEQLSAWASADRRLVLLARRFDGVARAHPRWVDWRRTWSHVVTCRTHTELVLEPWPTLLVAPGAIALRLIDRERGRGWVSHEPQDIATCKEQFDAVSQRSVETFPASALGL